MTVFWWANVLRLQKRIDSLEISAIDLAVAAVAPDERAAARNSHALTKFNRRRREIQSTRPRVFLSAIKLPNGTAAPMALGGRQALSDHWARAFSALPANKKTGTSNLEEIWSPVSNSRL